MNFKRFEGFFLERYPEGMVVQHGKFGGTEKNYKVAVVFAPDTRVYEYYGSYQSILLRLGIKVAYREDLERMASKLEALRERDGKPDEFFGGPPVDLSAEIAELEQRLAEWKTYTIV